MPARLRPTAPIAADAILVGDPGRALLLAQELLEQPKMSNHARGLWGYSGETAGGEELTIQATGMGGPSAAVVLADLAELGVRRAIRVGTCTALETTAQAGDCCSCRGDRRRRQRRGPGVELGERSCPTPSLLKRCRQPRDERRAARSPASTSTRRTLRLLSTTPRPPTCRPRRCSPAGASSGIAAAAVLIVSEARRRAARRRGARDGGETGRPSRRSRTLTLK